MKRPTDKKIHTYIKVLMTAIFLWSGLIWSGMAILQFFINDTSNAHLASKFLLGDVILLAGLILAWARVYILQLIPCLVGLIIYLQPAREMIDHAAETGKLFKPTFEQRYLPIIGFAILSFVLFILRVYAVVSSRIEKQEEFNNLPAESVLEKRSDAFQGNRNAFQGNRDAFQGNRDE